MGNTTTLKMRIKQKIDTPINWETAGDNGFIPFEGEYITYRDSHGDADDVAQGYWDRIKIGDGSKNVNDLPFATDIATILGSSNVSAARSSLPVGKDITIEGKRSIGVGSSINISGNTSAAFGSNLKIYSNGNTFAAGSNIDLGSSNTPIENSIVIGTNLNQMDSNTITLGSCNNSNSSNQFFTIGNGYSTLDEHRHNAIELSRCDANGADSITIDTVETKIGRNVTGSVINLNAPGVYLTYSRGIDGILGSVDDTAVADVGTVKEIYTKLLERIMHIEDHITWKTWDVETTAED